jgi:hypothetical protein
VATVAGDSLICPESYARPGFGAPLLAGIVAAMTDPLRDPLNDEHAGVLRLRAAAHALDHGDAVDAVTCAADARRIGVPAELVPYLAVVDGIARVLAGDPAGACTVLADAWASHPDVAALPAALGAARIAAEDATSAAHSMYAALVSDDPDRSLAIHRRRLTLLLGVVRGG